MYGNWVDTTDNIMTSGIWFQLTDRNGDLVYDGKIEWDGQTMKIVGGSFAEDGLTLTLLPDDA